MGGWGRGVGIIKTMKPDFIYFSKRILVRIALLGEREKEGGSALLCCPLLCAQEAHRVFQPLCFSNTKTYLKVILVFSKHIHHHPFLRKLGNMVNYVTGEDILPIYFNFLGGGKKRGKLGPHLL